MYIYIATNTVNKKQYVGQSIHHPKTKRIPKHKMALGKYAISNAIRKHGFESFTWEIISYLGASQESLNAIEKWHITKLNTLSPNGYNLAEGGGAGGKYTPEARSKISKGLTGKKLPPKHRENISKSLMGNKHPNYGGVISHEQRIKIGNTNRKHHNRKRGQLTLFD